MTALSGSIRLQKAFFDRITESQFSLDKAMALQLRQLERLLRHARDYVPFYKHRLDPMFRRNGEIDWSGWNDIPILKRADLIEHREEMQARVLPPEYGPCETFTTSGSTGVPVSTTHNARASLVNQANKFRAQQRYGFDWRRTMCVWFGDEEDEAAWPQGREQQGWGPAWDDAGKSGLQLEINRYTTAEQMLEFISRRSVSVLSGRPKWIQALARESLRSGLSAKLDAVTTFGTGITEDEREDVRSAFGCEMKALYSSKEAYAVGHECAVTNQLHLNVETVRVEVVDEEAYPVTPGVMGRVLVTPLYSGAQPLIRYDQGDLAIPAGNCHCGVALPALERVVGRVIHLFRFPDGSVVAPTMGAKHRQHLKASHWQIAQIAPLHIEVRYVPFDWDEYGEEQPVVDMLKRQTHRDANITFRRVRSIAPTQGDKYVEYVSELPR